MAAPALGRFRLALASLVLIAASSCQDTTAPSIEDTNFHSSLGVDLAASTRTESGLYYRDIAVGTGATAAPGARVFVGYALFNTNGSTWERTDPGETIDFVVASSTETPEMIPGFNEGVTGMKEGGRRQLIIPPHLGYGNRWQGVIPPNSILIFDVTLVDVQ